MNTISVIKKVQSYANRMEKKEKKIVFSMCIYFVLRPRVILLYFFSDFSTGYSMLVSYRVNKINRFFIHRYLMEGIKALYCQTNNTIYWKMKCLYWRCKGKFKFPSQCIDANGREEKKKIRARKSIWMKTIDWLVCCLLNWVRGRKVDASNKLSIANGSNHNSSIASISTKLT